MQMRHVTFKDPPYSFSHAPLRTVQADHNCMLQKQSCRFQRRKTKLCAAKGHERTDQRNKAITILDIVWCNRSPTTRQMNQVEATRVQPSFTWRRAVMTDRSRDKHQDRIPAPLYVTWWEWQIQTGAHWSGVAVSPPAWYLAPFRDGLYWWCRRYRPVCYREGPSPVTRVHPAQMLRWTGILGIYRQSELSSCSERACYRRWPERNSRRAGCRRSGPEDHMREMYCRQQEGKVVFLSSKRLMLPQSTTEQWHTAPGILKGGQRGGRLSPAHRDQKA